jgi:hypothetical protein
MNAYVALWHLAGMTTVFGDVGFRRESGLFGSLAASPLVTRLRHSRGDESAKFIGLALLPFPRPERRELRDHLAAF